jgi:hypothetical protein
MMGFDAVHTKHGGAWRLWVLCKKLDENGCSSVDIHDLKRAVDELGINPRCFRLWMADALALGLFVEGAGRYWLTSAGKAARLLGCPDIGLPAAVSLKMLFRKGWKAVLWAGYLATLGGRPVSQRTKQTVTRVQVRTQRRYQKVIEVKRIKNVAEVDAPRDAFGGLVEFDARVIYKSGDKLMQRLPDSLLVGSETARSLPKGRTRKIQKQLSSCSLGRGKPNCFRLFYGSDKSANGAARRLAKSDDYDKPLEVFTHIKHEIGVNTWQSVRI